MALAAPTSALNLNGTGFTYDVPGELEPLTPPTPNTAWAAAAAMLFDWRQKALLPIGVVVERAGPDYRSALQRDRPLSVDERGELLRHLGLVEEPPRPRSVDDYRNLLRRFGPLWIVAPGGGPGEVMTGAHGDGTVDGTQVWLIDPATGGRHHETWARFAAAYERASVGHPG